MAGHADPDPIDPALVTAPKAPASEKRLLVLAWLRESHVSFPEQRDGDLVEDGVCGVFLAGRLGAAQPILRQDMRLLVASSLVRQRKTKQWTFYKRNEAKLADVVRAVEGEGLGVPVPLRDEGPWPSVDAGQRNLSGRSSGSRRKRST